MREASTQQSTYSSDPMADLRGKQSSHRVSTVHSLILICPNFIPAPGPPEKGYMVINRVRYGEGHSPGARLTKSTVDGPCVDLGIVASARHRVRFVCSTL